MEGELKKRIREVMPWHYKENSEEHCDCQLEPLWKILDEVSKEFPLNYKELGFPKTPFDNESDNEIGKWFLKYFGGQK